MNRRSGPRNKLIYLAIMIVMLLPLYLLGQPATRGVGDTPGQLTQMRKDFGLAEASLGEIDPASETMKLASLGFRGVAVTMLRKKADEYKVLHEWDRLSATLNQMSKLLPHYENVWEEQAHNLAYNVSLEFDGYRQRYLWVKKGSNHLTKGVRTNRVAPRLTWYTAWIFGNKLGMSDEKTQFRELFRDDTAYHERILEEGIAIDSPEARAPRPPKAGETRSDNVPDNWLVGRLWAIRGYDQVDGGVRLVGRSPSIFYELGPKWRIMHADAIQKEGILDDRSKEAWERAASDWYDFGLRPLGTSDSMTVQLGTIGDLYTKRGEMMTRFEELVGDTMQRLKDEAQEKLSDAERKALAMAAEDRDRNAVMLAMQAEEKLQIAPSTVARAADEKIRLKAIQMALEIDTLDERISRTSIYRNQMNYDSWAQRCQAEQDDLVVEARRLLYQAQQLRQEDKPFEEIAKLEEAFKQWSLVLEKHPAILDVTIDDLVDNIDYYRTVATDQKDLPDDFPLKAAYERHKAAQEAGLDTDEMMALEKSSQEPQGLPKFDLSQPYLSTPPLIDGPVPAAEGNNGDKVDDDQPPAAEPSPAAEPTASDSAPENP